jgi:hypothetical protein
MQRGATAMPPSDGVDPRLLFHLPCIFAGRPGRPGRPGRQARQAARQARQAGQAGSPAARQARVPVHPRFHMRPPFHKAVAGGLPGAHPGALRREW